jgi:Tol biopolymer transport system component
MTTNEQFERGLTAWLHDDAAFRVPDHLDEVLQATRSTGQRPAWSSLERWLPVDTTFRPRFFDTPSAGRVLAVAALILILVAVAVFAIGSQQQRLPAPFGLARNGAMVTSRDGDLYRLGPATDEARRLAVGEGYDFSPIYSRDGSKFAFLRSAERPSATPGSVAVLTMYVASADGSGARPITPPTESLDWFDWSPDGTKVAYMARGFLYVVSVAGGDPVRLSNAGRIHFPTWLPPDGQEIVFRTETRSPGIYAIGPDATSKRRPLSFKPANNEADYQGITVAPDGKRIAFTRWTGDDVSRVYILDVASGAETVLPTDGVSQRGNVFSPDGKLIAYARVESGHYQIVVANTDGSGNERPVGPVKPGPGKYEYPAAAWAFTPDGTALVIRYGNDDRGTTQLIPIDGSPTTDLGSGGFEFVDVQRLAP